MEKNIKRKKKLSKTKLSNKRPFIINLSFVALIGIAAFLMLFYQKTMAADPAPSQIHGTVLYHGKSPFTSQDVFTIMGVYETQQPAYCLNHDLDAIGQISSIGSPGEVMTLQQSDQDAGMTYILQNGYPNANPLGGSYSNEDQYIVTQWAVWIYLYDTGQDLSGKTGLHRTDVLTNYGEYSAAVQRLVDGAKNAKSQQTEPTLSFNGTVTISPSSDGNNFETSMISINASSNLTSYAVEVTAPSGFSVVTNSGTTIAGTDLASHTFSPSESFKIVVPASTSINSGNRTISIKVRGTFSGSAYYRYVPTNTNVQHATPAIVYTVTSEKEIPTQVTIPVAKLSVLKVDAETNQPIAGATLRLKNSNGDVVEEWVTTTEAKVFDNLLVGSTYTVEEVSSANGYVNQGPSKSITLTADNVDTPATITMENGTTKIQIGKIDLETGKYIAGATLRIVNQETGEVYLDNIVTTEEPTLITKIPVGTYVLQEVSAPSGYVLNPTSLMFTVSNTGSVQQVFIKNNYTYVSIADQKISIDLSIKGYKIEIKDSAGKVVDSYTSDGKVHTTDELPVGRYTIEEVEAPAGYVCYPSPIEVYVPEKGTVGANELYFPNDYTKVQISKEDITTNKELPGAEIEIHDENGDVIEKWTSTDTPHEIDRLPVGKYELVETIAPEGYTLQENAISFEVLETGEIQSCIMYNQPKVEVPNTADNANIVTYLCGIVIVLCGIGLILYNVHEHKKKKK